MESVFPGFREFPEAGAEADKVIPGTVAGLLHQLLAVRETHRSHVRVSRNSRPWKRKRNHTTLSFENGAPPGPVEDSFRYPRLNLGGPDKYCFRKNITDSRKISAKRDLWTKCFMFFNVKCHGISSTHLM